MEFGKSHHTQQIDKCDINCSFAKVFCEPGQPITLLCGHYHENTLASQLSVQWRSPHNELLCHYIKHKTFQNCMVGYSITDTDGGIVLTIQRVKTKDIGSHVCSVSKPHEFSDHIIELTMVTKPITSPPQRGLSRSSPNWSLILLLIVCLVVIY
ncbi:uncharacterized protein ACBT44_005941 isoform 2-T2 [Syngnathus typhle]